MKDLLYILTTTAGTETLDISPDGYDDGVLTFERGDTYWGAFRKWSIPLKFVKRGAYLIRSEFYVRGMRGIVGIEIQKLNRKTLTYRTIYTGVGDFMTFRDSVNHVEIAFKDSGLAKYVKENSGNEYQFSHGEFITASFAFSSLNYDAINIYHLFYALIDKMTGGGLTGGTYLFRSDYLGEIGTNITGYTSEEQRRYLITNGVNLINPGVSVTSGNYYIISFDALFKSVNVFGSIGMGIETDSDTGKETLRIEPKSHFFDTSEDIIDIGNVKGFSASVDKNLSAGKVEIGWPGGTDDKDVITYEPCAKSQWQLPNFNNDKKLDIVSSVRADGTEIVRIISEGDDKSANELFFVEVDANETFTVFTFKNDGTGSVTTDTPPTPFSVYNASLTPRNCMLNHVNYLSCLNWNYSGYPAIYISGENRLNDISIKQYNEGFATMENADINLVTPIYFYPIVFEIDAIISNQIIDLLNANPHRKISFTFEDNNYQGWLKDITINIYRNSEGKIKLLACAGFGNIIYNLIR